MARKPTDDERQEELFGAPAVPAPVAIPVARARPRRPPPEDEPPLVQDDLETRLGRLSTAELRMLVAGMPDPVLAELVLSAIRQLRRRLAREGRYGGKGRASVLQRAAQQLVEEFREETDEDF